MAVLALGCSTPGSRLSREEASQRTASIAARELVLGEEVSLGLGDPSAVERWVVRGASTPEVVVLRLRGDPVAMRALQIRVLLPGDVVVAVVAPGAAPEFALALSGRPGPWTVELRLGDRGTAAEGRFRLERVRPSPPSGSAGSSCRDALRSRGLDAWVVAAGDPPPPAALAFTGLGVIATSARPDGALAASSPVAGAPAVLHLRGGAVLSGDVGGLGCKPTIVQVSLWDTGRGKPPMLSAMDAGGQPLCGAQGQPACPVNPAPGRWVSWTLRTTAPIGRFLLEGDELFLSGIVIQ